MARELLSAADHVGDANLAVCVGRKRAVAGGGVGIEDVDVIDQREAGKADPGDLDEGARPSVGPGVDAPGKPQLVRGTRGAGDAGVGTIQPPAAVWRARDVAVAAQPA